MEFWTEGDDRLRFPGPAQTYREARMFRTFAVERERCIYIGKGPSAKYAQEFIDQDSHVATLNDACRLFDGPVDYAFFLDRIMLENCRSEWDRIRTFVVTPYLHPGDDTFPVPLEVISGFPFSRALVLPQEGIDPSRSAIIDAHESDKVMLSNTNTFGLHCLALLGYKEILLFGHDGGVGYSSNVLVTNPGKDNSGKRRALEFVASRLSDQVSVKIWQGGQLEKFN